MPLPEAATAYLSTTARHRAAALLAARRAWLGMGADFSAQWARVLRDLTAITVAAQVGSATDAAAYVPAVLAELGIPDAPAGELVPAAFAGVASDGRSLDGLLTGALVKTRTAVAGGVAPAQALDVGWSFLETAIPTEISDAGRAAESTGWIAQQRVHWYVRVLSPPSCSRCTILAGRKYRTSVAFRRHNLCDCRMIGLEDADQADGLTTDPMAAFRAGQVRGLSKAETDAVQQGADLGQVVNAHRKGAYSGVSTTEGTTRRGLAGPGRRMTVAQIQRVASDREEQVALLRKFEYLTG